MVIVKFFLSLLVLDSQDVCFRVHSQTVICPIQDFQMSILGQNTAAKVTLFCVLPKYFVRKMHKIGWFVRKWNICAGFSWKNERKVVVL